MSSTKKEQGVLTHKNDSWNNTFTVASFKDFEGKLDKFLSELVTEENTVQLLTIVEEYANEKGYTLIGMFNRITFILRKL